MNKKTAVTAWSNAQALKLKILGFSAAREARVFKVVQTVPKHIWFVDDRQQILNLAIENHMYNKTSRDINYYKVADFVIY